MVSAQAVPYQQPPVYQQPTAYQQPAAPQVFGMNKTWVWGISSNGLVLEGESERCWRVFFIWSKLSFRSLMHWEFHWISGWGALYNLGQEDRHWWFWPADFSWLLLGWWTTLSWQNPKRWYSKGPLEMNIIEVFGSSSEIPACLNYQFLNAPLLLSRPTCWGQQVMPDDFIVRSCSPVLQRVWVYVSHHLL